MLPQWLCGRERLNTWGRAWTVAVSRWTRTIAGRYGLTAPNRKVAGGSGQTPMRQPKPGNDRAQV